MQKLKHYIVFWVALVSLFNVACFITPQEWYGTSKYSGAFWSGYAFITGAFILHLLYAVFAFRENNKEKKVLNNPITIISFFELGIMVVVGMVCMIVPALPNWVGIILCYTVMAFSVVFLVSAKAVEENKYSANKRLNDNTAFIRELSDVAINMVSSSRTDSIRRNSKAIYEAIRYSDPISSDETRTYEEDISNALTDLSNMLQSGIDEESFSQKADDILLLIEKRNNKCKALKRRV